MIFVDSNVPMYLLGAEHPHKRDALTLLERLASEDQKLVTSVEVLQEIIHRYVSIQRRDAIQPTFDTLYRYVDEVFDVTEADVLDAKSLVLSYERLSARDALHAAQMKRLKIETVFSFDRGFDILPNLKRIPAAVP